MTKEELDNIFSLEYSGVPKAELKRIRDDTLDFNAWFEAFGRAWPSAEDFEDYGLERKRRVGKTPTQPYAPAEKATARVRGFYEVLARQKGANTPMEKMSSEVVEVQDARANEEASQGELEQGVSEIEAPSTPKPRRGRKPKPENAGRVQVSVYLSRESYEAVRDLASFNSQNISDLLARLVDKFIEKNRETLERGREKTRELHSLKVEI